MRKAALLPLFLALPALVWLGVLPTRSGAS
jgi:hypothetical protein